MRAPLPRLHAITDERIARRAHTVDIARRLAAAGNANIALHARGRDLTGLEHYELARSLAAFPPTPLFVNDRLEIALACGAAGVQLGHASLDAAAARRFSAAWWIGCSVQNQPEAAAARSAGADYLVAGPVFPTASHPGRDTLDSRTLQAIVALGLPVVAIGGVTADRVAELKGVGVYGVAAIRAFWDASDQARAVTDMLRPWKGAV